MKKVLVSLAFALTVIGGFAQESDIDPKFASYMIETERRTVFVQNMNLNEVDAKVFWVIYDAFETELKPLRESGVANLKAYGEQYEKMTDDQAAAIMKTSLANEAKRAKIRKKYYNKMAKELGAKTASRFMQLDTVVSMILKLSIYDELPLIGDFN
tara:strand:- start:48985 stop:49452 length:468 start_codon:yes stop_codon:yes gene_type:complete